MSGHNDEGLIKWGIIYAIATPLLAAILGYIDFSNTDFNDPNSALGLLLGYGTAGFISGVGIKLSKNMLTKLFQ